MSKIRIREGNDFDVAWAIKRGGVPEDFAAAVDMRLTMVVYGTVIEHELFTITDNILSINVPKEVATVNGDYRLVFEYTLPDAGQPDGDLKCKTDVVPFRIVPFTAQADDIYTIDVASDVAIGFKGDKGEDGDDAYQIWLDLGNVGTYEDYIAYLRQPAVDAGASIAALELIIEGNESGRVTAEGERDAAEILRLSAESGRATAEGLRDGAEVLRIAADGVRDDNEGDRITAESDRADAEELRDGAELLRDAAEEERIAAEILREANIQAAIDAAALANTKAGLADTAAAAANTATGLADAATIAANTAAGNAQDVADTVDGRVTAVEDDLVQLAGDVSLLDAVHSDKIRDIENVISTMNPNQSAQLSVSGRKIVSLPKNASNSGMSVKLEGLTATNLVSGKAIANGSSVTFQTVTGNKYYLSNKTIITGDGNIYTFTNSTGAVADLWAVDLTATFGAGNEPDLATCDAMFSDYFEGVKSFVPTGRIRSVGKNLFNGKWRVGKAYTAAGVLADSSTQSVTELCRVSGATSYRFDWKDFIVNAIFQFDSERRYIPPAASNTSTNRNITTDVNCRYIALRLATLTPSTQELRLTYGLTETPYEPYRETSLYLTAPELRSNGTVKDEIRKGANGYELVKRISDVDGTVLATPVITPISYGGVLNSAENGTVYHEPIIADAGVYSTNMPILLTDYPISALEEIIIHKDGIDTYLDVSTAVIAPDGLSFTHPSLQSGDLVLFTYGFDKESTNGNITATFYDSNVVKIDTGTGKAYKITDVVTNGVLTRTLTEV